MKLSEENKRIIEDYGHLFVNTGGNNVAELLEREGVTLFNNSIVALLQNSCISQVQLLRKLEAAGLLSGRKKEDK